MKLSILFILLIFSSASNSYDIKDLWLQKSFGEYKVKVFRVLGEAHASDHVEIDIYNISDSGERTLHKTVELPSPGYKGYISEVYLTSINKGRIAVNLQIEMKAMEGVVLSELFIVNKKGKIKLVTEANYADLYQDL